MVAMESAPRWATQNMSTTAKRDSIIISSIIGMASSMMARPMRSSVKSRWMLPITASRMDESRLLRWVTANDMNAPVWLGERFPQGGGKQRDLEIGAHGVVLSVMITLLKGGIKDETDCSAGDDLSADVRHGRAYDGRGAD